MTGQNGNSQNANKQKRSKAGRGSLLLLAIATGCLGLIAASLAWYTIETRTVESQSAEVMKPYYLTVLNPGETDILNLTVGNLYPGETKNILFCVSNKNNTADGLMSMGGSDFNYIMQLVYTNNLAVEYHLYELSRAQEAEAGNEGIYVSEDTDNTDLENPNQIITTCWKKKEVNGTVNELACTDISSAQHEKAGLTETEKESVNAGTYKAYELDAVNEKLNLTSSKTEGYDSDYYLLQINWKNDEISNFEKYEKETDVIYLLVQAMQPEPTKKTQEAGQATNDTIGN